MTQVNGGRQMQKRQIERIEFRLEDNPNAGWVPLLSAGKRTPVLYILLMVPGVFVSLLALTVYPPVNTRLAMGIMLCIFVLPVLLLMLGFVRKQPSGDIGVWKRIYLVSSLALVLFGVLLFLNGNLDKSNPRVVKATVVQKTILRGRRGTQYSITVSSWQPGRIVEYFNISSDVYNKAVVGKMVTVELHNGLFAFPWHGKISPE